MVSILNKNIHTIPEDAIYIGRGSKWGNPFKIGIDGNRAEVIFKYEQWLKLQTHLLEIINELQGKNLVCFCKPKSCHGDILFKVLTMTKEQRILWASGSMDWNNFYENI